MSSLDLQIEGPSGVAVTDKTFSMLRDYLQPDAALTLESTAQSILNLLPEKAPESTEVWSFGEVCIEVAEQTPYHHPSQLKLAGLLEHLGASTKLTSACVSKGTNVGRYFRYQMLGESLRDALNSPEPENPSVYVNFHAFAANLNECGVFRTDPTWAIWAQRDAHETRQEAQDSIRDAYVSAAAQWIFWYGQSLFKQVLFPASPDDLRPWRPGPLYDGKANLSLQRWHFWRDGFKAVAFGERGEEKGFGQECKSLAARAAEMMDSLEKNMTF